MLSRYRKAVCHLLEQLQLLREDPYDRWQICYNLQEELIRRVCYVEKQIRTLKRQTRDNPSQESRADLCRRIESYREILFVLRSVGDGIAFIYIDRWDIKALAFNGSPGFISGKDGFENEWAFLQQVRTLGVPALLADLTHCLTYGDLYVFKEGRRPIIVEVKGDSSGGRDRRQIRRLRRVADYLNTGRIENYRSSGFGVVRIEPHAPAHFHEEGFNIALSEAMSAGRAIVEIEPGVTYIVQRFPHFAPRDVETVAQHYHRPLVYLLNDTKFHSEAYYPFVLSWRDSRALFEFYTGGVVAAIVIDLDSVIACFVRRGWTAEVLDDPNVLLRLNAGGEINDRQGMMVSWYLVSRVAFEFLSLDWLIEEISRPEVMPWKLLDGEHPGLRLE